MVTDVECRAMAYVVSRTVAPELKPAVLALAAVPGPWGLRALPWTEMLGCPAGDIVDLLAGFYAERGEGRDRAREQARRTWALYG
jgi:hypothetical protein